MSVNKYVGSRYVPLYIGIHDDSIEYEPLSIVSNAEKTETYTSKQHVPIGISLDNETYWVQSGFSNPDLVITIDNEKVDSTKDSELKNEKVSNGYHLTMSDSNSFLCGSKFGDSLTLNTMFDVGRYVFKPSVSSGVPNEISELETPAELIITDYEISGSEIVNHKQEITAYDNDNAAIFVRTNNGIEWSEWKMIGASGGGSYTLPIASPTVLGGVKIGENVNISNDGTISVDKGTQEAAKWRKLDSSEYSVNIGTIDSIYEYNGQFLEIEGGIDVTKIGTQGNYSNEQIFNITINDYYFGLSQLDNSAIVFSNQYGTIISNFAPSSHNLIFNCGYVLHEPSSKQGYFRFNLLIAVNKQNS